ncbi:MAG TPA: SusC/RagA family TonB-linked outer membrane protein, partial [Thermomicrobiales bacterium]|nr:SusC/RagA family TonB-linked outer membrane protein [Thermomicrobiales bacterium]
AQITNQLRAGLRVGPSYSRRNQPTAGGEGRQAGTGITMLACPLGQAYDEEGNLLPFIDSGNICPGVWRLINPLYAVNNIQDERNALTALASGYLHLDVTNFLSIRTNLNAEWSQNERKFFQPSTIGSNNNPPPSIPTGSYSSGRSLNWLSETTVNLATPFGPGQLDGLAGITFQRQNTYSSTFSGQFPDDDIRTLNVASNITGNSNESAWSLVSYLARANYNWKERLVFTATSRIDGSSRFGARNRWGLFPSAAIAWYLHNEAFMSGLSESVPELRIRASYGVTGNNQIGNYSSLSTVQKDDYMLGGSVVGGRRVTTLGNEELGWERTFETNFAIDAALLDQRLGVTVELYNRRTTDLLIDHPLPTSSGFGTITANTGVVRNRGMEIAIHSTNLTRPGFNWSTDFAWSLNRNKVLSLPGGEPIYTGNWGGQPTHVTAEGQPLGLMIGLVHDGIYQNEAEVAAGPVDPGVQPGNIRWKDVNGDGQITIGRAPDGDYGIIGNPHPDFTFAINNAISLGRFDFRVNVTGRKGGDILRFGYYQSAMNVEGVFNVAAEYVENMWISEDQPGTMPTPIGNREAIRRFHTQHSGAVADGSNIWVRSATLRYNVPQGFAGLGQMSIYLSALNPLVFTSYRGNPDVEANQSAGSLQLGVEDHAYPIARQFTVGVEMSF